MPGMGLTRTEAADLAAYISTQRRRGLHVSRNRRPVICVQINVTLATIQCSERAHQLAPQSEIDDVVAFLNTLTNGFEPSDKR